MKIKLAVTGAAIAALALAGCSSDSDEETEASPSPSAEETMDTEAGTIVDVAAGAEGFETLVTAVGAADLTETLNGEGPFTVFAPTDEAFAAVDQATLDLLLLPSNQEALASVLTYHVVPDEILSSDIPEGETMVASVETSELTVVNEGGTVTVNGANVTTADVMASNGVIHVIDAVLLPPDFDPASLATE